MCAFGSESGRYSPIHFGQRCSFDSPSYRPQKTQAFCGGIEVRSLLCGLKKERGFTVPRLAQSGTRYGGARMGSAKSHQLARKGEDHDYYCRWHRSRQARFCRPRCRRRVEKMAAEVELPFAWHKAQVGLCRQGGPISMSRGVLYDTVGCRPHG